MAPGMGSSARPRASRACSGEAASRASSPSRWAASEGDAGGLDRTRPAEQDRLVQDAAHRVEVRREVEVKAQVGVEGEHGHAVARGERGEELLGLADGAEETAQATALEVLLEEKHDQAPRGERRARGGRARGHASHARRLGHPHRGLDRGTPAVHLQPEVGGRQAGQGPSATVGDPDLQDDTRGLDAGEAVRRLLRRPRRGERRGAEGRREPEGDGHRADASTRARAGRARP